MTTITTPPRERRAPGRPRDPALPEKRCGQILRAATRLFAKRGYAKTDLQDVADALKLGKGTIYRYFPSKQVLFQAAVDRVMRDMRSAIDRSIEPARDPLDRIGLAIRTYLKFFHDHPEYVELLILERAEFRDRKKPTYFAYREANRGRWHDFYSDLIREGRIRNVPVERLMEVLGDLIY